MREAVGTSLLVIAINSAAGFAGHLGGGQLNAGLITLLATAAVVGALAGERVARQVVSPESAFPLDANTLRWLRRNAQLLRRFPLPSAPERCSHDGAMFALKSDRDLRSTLDSLTVEEV